MSTLDWKAIAIIVAFLVGALLLPREPGPEPGKIGSSNAQSSIKGQSLEEILAYEQTGRPPSEYLVGSFRVRLTSITRQCGWTRREASDKLLRMYQILRDEGKQVELFDLAVGLDRAKQGVTTDCHELLATLGAMAGTQ